MAELLDPFPLEAPPDFALSEGGRAPTKLWNALVRYLRARMAGNGGEQQPAERLKTA